MKLNWIIFGLLLIIPLNGYPKNCGVGVDDCACGDTLTASYTLTANLDCSGWDNFEALTIGANGITLDGGGYRIDNCETLGAWAGPDGNGEYNIAAPAGTDNQFNTGKYILLKDGIPVNVSANDGEGGLSEGYYCFDLDTAPDTIYYKPVGAEAMGDYTWEICTGVGVDLNSSDNVTIQNLQIYGAKEGIYDDSTAAAKPTGLTVKDCTISRVSGHGIYLCAGDSITIGDPTANKIATEDGFSNEIFYATKGGIKLGSAPASEDTACDSSIVAYNYLHDNYYSYVYYSAEKHVIDINPYGDNDTIIFNYLVNNGRGSDVHYSNTHTIGKVVSVDGVDGVVVRKNHIKDNYQGAIEIGPDVNHCSIGAFVDFNIIDGNGKGTVTFLAYGRQLRTLTIDNECGAQTAIDVVVVNNIFMNNEDNYDASGGNIYQHGAWTLFAVTGGDDVTLVSIKNNIFYNNTNYGDIRLTDGILDVPLKVTHNDVYRSGGGDTIANGAVDANPPTLYPVTNAMSDFDVNSFSSDPVFVNVGSGKLRLGTNSPCINSGTDPYATGDGNIYDIDHYIVWNDTIDVPVGPWQDGVEIGAYGFAMWPIVSLFFLNNENIS